MQTCGTSFCLEGSPIALVGASTLGGLDDPSGRIALAGAAHLNTVRVVDFLDEQAPDLATAPFDEARWTRVDREIAAARHAGLHVILDLSTYRNLLMHHQVNPYTFDWAPFVATVAGRVNTVTGVAYRDDPTIAIISIAGEVEPLTRGSAVTPTTPQLTEFYARTLREMHDADPNHLVSAGGLLQLDWNSGIDWRSIFELPGNDIPAIHVYSARDETVTLPAVAVAMRALGKPWIIEEFGIPQSAGDATRAAAFRRIFGEATTADAAGVLFWDLGPELNGVGGKAETYDINPATPLTFATVVGYASSR
jgi:endo-1,4-beta-mannosidase